MKMRFMFAHLLLVSFITTSCSTFYPDRQPAQSQGAEQDQSVEQGGEEEIKDEKDNIFKVVKEIYVKGSIDGKHLFMVYGMGEAKNAIKGDFKNIIRMRDLVRVKDAINNKEHRDDFVDSVKEGIEGSKESAQAIPGDVKDIKEAAQDIVKWPWKSISRMKESYKVSFDNARDSYYHAKNPIVGTLKYSGHAIWANVKGAYYLIVEIPVVTAAAVVETGVETLDVAADGAGVALSVPLHIIGQTLRVAWRSTVVGLKLATIPFRAAAAALQGGYSLLSTTTAATVTLIAAGGIATYKGTKWLVYTLPHRLMSPIAVLSGTEIPLDQQEEFAKKVKTEIEQSILSGIGLKLAKESIKEYRSSFTLSSDKAPKAIKISLGIDADKKVKISIEATNKFIKSIRQPNESRRDLEARVEGLLQKMADELSKA